MKSFLQAVALAATLIAPALVAPAQADGSYTGGFGGDYSWDRDCYNGAYFDACKRTRTYTGPGGNHTWERGRGWWSGPLSYGRGGHRIRPHGFTTGYLHGHGRYGGHYFNRGYEWR